MVTMNRSTKADNTKLQFVTTDIAEFGSVLANLSLTKVAIINCGIDEWQKLAAVLKPLLGMPRAEFGADYPLHYNSTQLIFFSQICEQLSGATTLAQVCLCLDKMLRTSAKPSDLNVNSKTNNSRDIANSMLRRGVRFILRKAREQDLLLFPAGCLHMPAVPWLGAIVPLELTLYQELQKQVEDFIADRFDKTYIQRMTFIFERFIAFVKFGTHDVLPASFFDGFWSWSQESPHFD